MELERLQERLLGSYTEQLESLIGEYHRYRTELLNRKPQSVPQYTLFRIVSSLRDQVERRLLPPKFVPEPDEPAQRQENP